MDKDDRYTLLMVFIFALTISITVAGLCLYRNHLLEKCIVEQGIDSCGRIYQLK